MCKSLCAEVPSTAVPEATILKIQVSLKKIV